MPEPTGSAALVEEDLEILLEMTSDLVAPDGARPAAGLLQAVLDHADTVIWAQDLVGRFTVVSRALCDLAGLGPETLLGRRPGELPGDGPSEVRRALFGSGADAAVLEGGPPDIGEQTLDLAGGARRLFRARYALRDERGAVCGLGVVAVLDQAGPAPVLAPGRDRLLDSIVRASPDLVVLVDARGRTQAVSEASTAIIGYTPNTPLESLTDLIWPEDRLLVLDAYRGLLAGDHDEVDLRYRVRHREGHWVTLDTRGRTMRDDSGRIQGAVVVARDVTVELETERRLVHAVEAAEQASAAKSEFLSRMSHELRTPLNSVLGFAQLLEMDDLSQAQHDAVVHILRAGRHLLDLIDEVLDIARIETGHVELSLEAVPLHAVIGDAVDLTVPLAERHGIEVSVPRGPLGGAGAADDEIWIRADRQRLLQVLLNLLSNGVKYNRRGGRVEIVASLTGSEVTVEVADTGPGIPPERFDRLFEPFDRLGAERSEVEGHGVGLTLSKQLVEHMGGTITARSDPGVGSVFTVAMPASNPAAAATTKSAPGAAGKGVRGDIRVLHVEDNFANLELVEQVLKRRGGVELLAAMHGTLAVELAREHVPDLVLLDMHLPDIQGDEVLRRLRAQPATAGIPVVVVSADATAEQRGLVEDLGVDAYLTKPVDLHQLLAVIDAVGARREGSSAEMATALDPALPEGAAEVPGV